MKVHLAAVAFLGALAGAAHAEPSCRGTISGSVVATFDCRASAYLQDGTTYFSIDGVKPIEGVPGYTPGTFELPGKVQPGTYTLETLGMGRSSVAAAGGTLYSATKTSSQRGEVTLILTSVRKDPKTKGAWQVHGSYRARLPPAGGGKTGEVVVEVTF